MPNQENPPQFRGSDFAMRWEQGKWSEDRIIEAINDTDELRAIPYGLSQIGPTDKDKIEEYWRKHQNVEQHGKRPDILVFKKEVYEDIEGDLPEDPTTTPDDEIEDIVSSSILGIEAENSLWKAKEMPDYGVELPLQTKSVTAPRIWVKDEDWDPLQKWKDYFSKPIFVVQVFYDEAFMVSLDWLKEKVDRIKEIGLKGRETSKLQKELGVLVKHQSYSDSRSGASQTKPVFTVLPSVSIKFGESIEEPEAIPNVMFEDNGKIIPYVRFKGGSLKLTEKAKEALLRGEMISKN